MKSLGIILLIGGMAGTGISSQVIPGPNPEWALQMQCWSPAAFLAGCLLLLLFCPKPDRGPLGVFLLLAGALGLAISGGVFTDINNDTRAVIWVIYSFVAIVVGLLLIVWPYGEVEMRREEAMPDGGWDGTRREYVERQPATIREEDLTPVFKGGLFGGLFGGLYTTEPAPENRLESAQVENLPAGDTFIDVKYRDANPAQLQDYNAEEVGSATWLHPRRVENEEQRRW
jgi:hypothetical protein